MNTESLNLLEPSGPLQACNGIYLYRYLYLYNLRYTYVRT